MRDKWLFDLLLIVPERSERDIDVERALQLATSRKEDLIRNSEADSIIINNIESRNFIAQKPINRISVSKHKSSKIGNF